LRNSGFRRVSNGGGSPRREIYKEVCAVTNFEAITKNPETLAAFLRGLPILEGPWDEEFQRNYCAGCGKVSCDDGSHCPYEDKRNSPGWWLGLEAVAAEAV
jgi:hypothetical protein